MNRDCTGRNDLFLRLFLAFRRRGRRWRAPTTPAFAKIMLSPELFALFVTETAPPLHTLLPAPLFLLRESAKLLKALSQFAPLFVGELLPVFEMLIEAPPPVRREPPHVLAHPFPHLFTLFTLLRREVPHSPAHSPASTPTLFGKWWLLVRWRPIGLLLRGFRPGLSLPLAISAPSSPSNMLARPASPAGRNTVHAAQAHHKLPPLFRLQLLPGFQLLVEPLLLRRRKLLYALAYALEMFGGEFGRKRPHGARRRSGIRLGLSGRLRFRRLGSQSGRKS